MRTAPQNNSLGNVQRTLLDLSDPERQLAYKRQVPAVHVPIELLEQWSGHRRLLREQSGSGASSPPSSSRWSTTSTKS